MSAPAVQIRFVAARWVARRTVFTTVFAAFLLILGSGHATADDWGSQDGDTGAHPDTNPHTYCYHSSFTSELSDNVLSITNNALNDPTDANTDYQSSCDTGSTTETDVRWLMGNLTGATGQAPCANYSSSSGHCDRYDVTIDLAAVNVGSNDELDQSQTVCHELGHTVGLSHGSDDCMMSGEPPADIIFRRYGPHHRNGHIDDWF